MYQKCPTNPYNKKTSPYTDKDNPYTKKQTPYIEKENPYINIQSKLGDKYYCPQGYLLQGNSGYIKMGSGGRIILN